MYAVFCVWCLDPFITESDSEQKNDEPCRRAVPTLKPMPEVAKALLAICRQISRVEKGRLTNDMYVPLTANWLPTRKCSAAQDERLRRVGAGKEQLTTWFRYAPMTTKQTEEPSDELLVVCVYEARSFIWNLQPKETYCVHERFAEVLVSPRRYYYYSAYRAELWGLPSANDTTLYQVLRYCIVLPIKRPTVLCMYSVTNKTVP